MVKPWFEKYLYKGLTSDEIALLSKVVRRYPLDLQELIIEFYLSPPLTSILDPLMQLEKEKLKPKETTESGWKEFMTCKPAQVRPTLPIQIIDAVVRG